MLPDIIQDAITDGCKRLNLPDAHSFFLRAAHEHREPDVHGAAQTAFFIWAREGYNALPEYIKDFALRACNGEFRL